MATFAGHVVETGLVIGQEWHKLSPYMVLDFSRRSSLGLDQEVTSRNFPELYPYQENAATRK